MVIKMTKLTSIVSKFVYYITTRQLDHFVNKNKAVFEELAKQ